MSPLNTAILTCLVAATVSSGWHHYKRRSAEVAHPMPGNKPLPQLIKTTVPKSEAARSSPTSLENLWLPVATPSPAKGSDPTRLVGVEHVDAGQATPIAALQTLVWACEQREMARVEALITFDSAAQEKAARYYESLPDRVRTNWPTIDAMAAALLISEALHHPYPVNAVLRCAEERSIDPERVEVLLPGTRRERLEFQLTSSGWRHVITEATVDQYLAGRGRDKRGER